MHTARSAMPTGLALTTAVSLAFTPLMLPAPAMRDIALPNITAPRLQLAAAINPADVDALVANLNAALNSASGTVTNLVGAPGQTVSGALNSAVSLNDTLWAGLIDATDSKPLLAIIKTLKASAGNGLSQLATTVDSANGDVVLATGQLTDLLTSTITGSLGSVLHAVATVVNNPLALPSYTGLINAPIDIAGLLLTQGIGAVDNLGTNVLSVTNTVVRGVTAQVSNALDTFNGLIGAGKTLTDLDLINGLLTAVQGIVSAPVTAAVAGVNGLSTTIVNAASTALGRVADGASDAIATWIGDGTGGGAIQHVINTIGSAPLSAASYTRAISVLVGAGIGMAAYGLKPVVEIQFADYIYPGLDQLVSEAARLRYRSGGEFTAPMTVRSPFGGGIFGGQTHSQSPEALFAHVAGIKTVIPSTPYEAKGLLIGLAALVVIAVVAVVAAVAAGLFN